MRAFILLQLLAVLLGMLAVPALLWAVAYLHTAAKFLALVYQL